MSTTFERMPLERKIAFITEYASWLLGSGATCIRLEKNIGRIAKAFGVRVELTIMPRHLHITVEDCRQGVSVTRIVAPRAIAVNFCINTGLSRLSWEIADGQIDAGGIDSAFSEAVDVKLRNTWLITVLVSVANASFCHLFGGDWIAMAIVAVATLAGLWLKAKLLRYKCDTRIMMFLCALVSVVLGSTDALFAIGSTPSVAIGTSVLYLVPGIPFLNSFSDMIYRHYICAFCRFVDAVVMTVCLSAGLCAGMLLMNVGMF